MVSVVVIHFKMSHYYLYLLPDLPYRDMDQLSGGEKTMAALGLLFSIHR